MQGAWCSTPRASLSAGPASPWFVACPLGVCAGNLHYLLLPWFTAFTLAVSDLLTDRRGTSSQSSYALTGGHGLILKSLVLSSIRGEASLGRASRNRWNERVGLWVMVLSGDHGSAARTQAGGCLRLGPLLWPGSETSVWLHTRLTWYTTPAGQGDSIRLARERCLGVG